MKAIVFKEHGAADQLHYTDIPEPEPGPNDVIVQIHATACNYTDIWARRGLPGMKIIFPHVSGSDASGVVVRMGSSVTGISVGDEVMVHPGISCRSCEACTRGEEFSCRNYRIWGFQTGPNDGGQSEYSCLPAINVLPKPKNLSWEEAASLPLVLMTAWHMLVKRAQIQAGDFVLIWGAGGGLGSIALQVCRLFNAKAIAIAANDEKLAQAHKLGATHTINRTKENVSEAVLKITGKRGVDVVFEHVGKETWPTSVQSLRRGGTIVTCGATTGFDAITDLRFLWNKQLNLLGSHMGTKADLIEALRFVENGDIRPVVSEVLRLADVRQAHALIEEGKSVGKIVLIPDQTDSSR
jgi:NADPH:quinone reductase-like Zn-dependent oxidoreductase